MGFSSSTIHPSAHHHQYIASSTHNPLPSISLQPGDLADVEDEDEEYEYDDDDDYLTSDRDDQPPSKFSPHSFIYRQTPLKSNNLPSNINKPAISFQQQQFQNGDSLSVTVTGHNNQNGNLYKNQMGQNPSRPSQYSLYSYNPPQTQSAPSSKRIPLLPLAQEGQGPPSGHPGLQQLAPFRLRAQGFKLPQQHQPQPFDGYRRNSPQVRYLVSTRILVHGYNLLFVLF